MVLVYCASLPLVPWFGGNHLVAAPSRPGESGNPDWRASLSRHIRHAVALDTRRSVAQTRRARGSETMPEIYVHAIEGRSKEQKRALIKDITDAVVKNFGVGADAVLVEK